MEWFHSPYTAGYGSVTQVSGRIGNQFAAALQFFLTEEDWSFGIEIFAVFHMAQVNTTVGDPCWGKGLLAI